MYDNCPTPMSEKISITGCDAKNNPFVVLFSPSQKLFHIEYLSQLLDRNREPVFAGDTAFSDYALIGIEPTRDAAIAHIEAIKKIIAGSTGTNFD